MTAPADESTRSTRRSFLALTLAVPVTTALVACGGSGGSGSASGSGSVPVDDAGSAPDPSGELAGVSIRVWRDPG